MVDGRLKLLWLNLLREKNKRTPAVAGERAIPHAWSEKDGEVYDPIIGETLWFLIFVRSGTGSFSKSTYVFRGVRFSISKEILKLAKYNNSNPRFTYPSILPGLPRRVFFYPSLPIAECKHIVELSRCIPRKT